MAYGYKYFTTAWLRRTINIEDCSERSEISTTSNYSTVRMMTLQSSIFVFLKEILQFCKACGDIPGPFSV
jgi:hypothetical protein